MMVAPPEERACVPLGFAWSSPFARWQGPLAEINSLDLAVDVTGRALKERGLPPEEVTNLVLRWTVPQKEIFYGAPTLAARPGVEPGRSVARLLGIGFARVEKARMPA